MDTSILQNFKILLLENNLAIYHDLEDNWIYADWTGQQDLPSIKMGCEKLLHVLQNQPCSKLLNDKSHITYNWAESADWLTDDFAPQLSKGGIKYLAWVYPTDLQARQATERILLKTPAHTIAIGFDNRDTARAWLRSV